MPARDRSLGLGKCNTQENMSDLPRDAFKKLAQQPILGTERGLGFAPTEHGKHENNDVQKRTGQRRSERWAMPL
jgi:hypothetical protein